MKAEAELADDPIEKNVARVNTVNVRRAAYYAEASDYLAKRHRSVMLVKHLVVHEIDSERVGAERENEKYLQADKH